MLIILSILYFYQASIQAAPLTLLPKQNAPDLTSLQDCIGHNTRTLWDIIWSCMATIFACSWVSVHPNVSKPGGNRLTRSLQRLELMFWSIIAPELIIGWAMRQWWGARRLEATYIDHGWTKTHGHFIQMGGFALYKGNELEGVLYPEDLPRLLQEGKINMPTILEADIQDHSKRDGLAKALVVVQTSWFIVQCIVRKVDGLFLTQLELVTLALAVLNGVMYFLWWHKPLDVQTSIPIYLLDVSNVEPIDVSAPETGKFETERDLPSSAESLPPADVPKRQRWYHTFCHILLTLLRITWLLFSGILFRWPAALAWRALLRMRDMLHSEHSNHIEHSKTVQVKTVLNIREKLHAGISRPIEDGELQVPTFYAFRVDDTPTRNFLGMTAFIATIFGAIHCVGWYFTFSTVAEATIWRVLAAFITAGPVIGILIPPLYLIERYDNTSIKFIERLGTVLSAVLILTVPLYVLARLGLLVEALIALRNLPPEAFDVVKWTTFLPHI